MGQAMVDLPDPLETPPPKGGVGADDLLAQMAGDEIDRLLAEAEADTPSFPKEPPPPIDDLALFGGLETNNSTPAESASFASAIPTAPDAPTATAVARTQESTAANELDSLLESLTTASPRPPQSPPAPIVPDAKLVEAEQAAAIPAIESSAVNSSEAASLLSAAAADVIATGELNPVGEETSAAERSALSESTTQASSSDAAAPAAEELSTDQRDDSPATLPLLLRPLEWINAPLNSCPDLLREFIGKAAILTAVNAGAIIFYVRFIRRH